jgi:hypothetical protein
LRPGISIIRGLSSTVSILITILISFFF